MKTKTKDKILQNNTQSTAPAAKPLANNQVPSVSAANPAPPLTMADLTKPSYESGWAQEEKLVDNTPAITEDQLREFKNTGTVSGRAGGTGAGSGIGGTNPNMTISDDAKKEGVLAGNPYAVNDAHTLADITNKWNKNEEDLADLEKRKKQNALFSGISDGLSALANLYFTTKGSPSADQSRTMSRAQQEAYEKDRAFLEGRGRDLLAMKERALATQRANRYKLEELKLKREMNEAQRKLAEARTRAQLKRAEDYWKYLTEKNQLLKEAQEAEQKRKEALNNASIKQKNAVGAAAIKRANAYASDVENKKYNRTRNTTNMMHNRGKEYDYVTEGEQWTDEKTGRKHTWSAKKKVPRGSGNRPLGRSPQGL